MKRDGITNGEPGGVEMNGQSSLSEIKFDEWAAASEAARRTLLDLRTMAARADKSLARLESNQRKIQERLPDYCAEFAKILGSLRDGAQAAQSRVLNDHHASLPDSAREAIMEMIRLDGEAEGVRRALTGLNPNPADAPEFHPAASALTKSIRAAADVVAPIYTLLARLDADLERAAERYEELRGDLTRRLADWGSPLPDFHADEALDRVIRRIEEGEEIRDLSQFSRGVAWRVWQEYLAKIGDELPEGISEAVSEDPEVERERRYECMRECLAERPPETRWLIREYADPKRTGRQRIKHREELARMLEIPRRELTIRIFRIRAGLLECLDNCLKKVA